MEWLTLESYSNAGQRNNCGTFSMSVLQMTATAVRDGLINGQGETVIFGDQNECAGSAELTSRRDYPLIHGSYLPVYS